MQHVHAVHAITLPAKGRQAAAEQATDSGDWAQSNWRCFQRHFSVWFADWPSWSAGHVGWLLGAAFLLWFMWVCLSVRRACKDMTCKTCCLESMGSVKVSQNIRRKGELLQAFISLALTWCGKESWRWNLEWLRVFSQKSFTRVLIWSFEAVFRGNSSRVWTAV